MLVGFPPFTLEPAIKRNWDRTEVTSTSLLPSRRGICLTSVGRNTTCFWCDNAAANDLVKSGTDGCATQRRQTRQAGTHAKLPYWPPASLPVDPLELRRVRLVRRC
ncbi:unnamed protein product, partial [Ectocarpus sp. 12 AP-2014]